MKNFSSTEILGISKPEKLFLCSTEQELKLCYRKLSALWHPDKHISDGINTSDVFAHIQVLYEKAIVRINSGDWNKGNIFRVLDEVGKEFEIKYESQVPFEFGSCYIGRGIVAWSFIKAEEEFAKRAIKNIESLKFANNKMKEEVKKNIPEIFKLIKSKNETILVLTKDKDSISLVDVLSYYKGFVDPKHVAWILSGMYNLACFNQYNQLMSASFSLNNYFINPEQHSGQLIGGWWFACHQGEKLTALSTNAIDVAPIKMINKKIADIKLDLELIKLVGRQLLGDASGMNLKKDSRIPKPLVEWLNDVSSYMPFEAYDIWQNKVLRESFGVRRFTKMDLTINDIYN
ncbi:J domain-containing protein [archaeon]|nr:J domain-containing protein [archaeon]